MTTLTPDELAQKALYMQRDYTMTEIAELLGVRLEDLNVMIENYKNPKPEMKTEELKKKPIKKRSG